MRVIAIKPLYRQSFTHILTNDGEVNIELYFSDFMSCWYMDITYKNKQWKSLRLVVNDNILSQFVNVIPFGIAITGQFNPMFVDDFYNENNEFIILEKEDL
jgi:hypothetical protein